MTTLIRWWIIEKIQLKTFQVQNPVGEIQAEEIQENEMNLNIHIYYYKRKHMFHRKHKARIR